MGFPKTAFSEPPLDDFLCTACSNVLEDPESACEEGHTFCRECLVDCSSCPTCQRSVWRVPNKIVQNLIGNLVVRCPSKWEEGSKRTRRECCEWNGRCVELRNHLKTCESVEPHGPHRDERGTPCAKELLACPFKEQDCSVRTIAEVKGQHVVECTAKHANRVADRAAKRNHVGCTTSADADIAKLKDSESFNAAPVPSSRLRKPPQMFEAGATAVHGSRQELSVDPVSGNPESSLEKRFEVLEQKMKAMQEKAAARSSLKHDLGAGVGESVDCLRNNFIARLDKLCDESTQMSSELLNRL